MQMLNKTRLSHDGECPYGRKCCGSKFSDRHTKRRAMRRIESRMWKRDLRTNID